MEKLPINCDQTQEQLTEWLSNQLPDAERAIMDAHLAQCLVCQAEAASVRQLWQMMGQVSTPEPSPMAQVRFQAMLDTYKETISEKSSESFADTLWAKLQEFLTPKYAVRLAYSVALVGVGIMAGYWLQHSSTNVAFQQQQIDTLSTQVQEMRQMMLLSGLENPAASERLRAVSYTEEINQVDDKVVDALLTTLNNDANVNVRLVTLEALAKLADNPNVREGLVQSIAKQESPLMQSALADVMVKLQEKRSIKPLRQLLHDNNTNHLVKGKLEQTIRELS
ncbi:hypothetical protein GCM10028807_19050 [Spirosoma daeguense]